jgi:hypothetical protein
MLFWQTIAAIHHVNDHLKVQKLGGINNHNIN